MCGRPLKGLGSDRPAPPPPNRDGAKVHHHCIPPPSASTGQRPSSPASTVERTRTSHRIPCGLRPHPTALRVCAGHRSATEDADDLLIRNSLGTPTRYSRRAPTGVSAGQGPFQHVVAGEGFEPSKLSRWIYSPLPLAARATCLGADGRIATEPRVRPIGRAAATQPTARQPAPRQPKRPFPSLRWGYPT